MTTEGTLLVKDSPARLEVSPEALTENEAMELIYALMRAHDLVGTVTGRSELGPLLARVEGDAPEPVLEAAWAVFKVRTAEAGDEDRMQERLYAAAEEVLERQA
ncbi:hypothetical protein ACMX2H_18515 [Arthrobacter sulfonylureivorans]|uniref:hypothetical protein n=1 Tax=Arthrobacter sulfonylureivorans TaxID=2486855 RepID=UPI0039E32F64